MYFLQPRHLEIEANCNYYTHPYARSAKGKGQSEKSGQEEECGHPCVECAC